MLSENEKFGLHKVFKIPQHVWVKKVMRCSALQNPSTTISHKISDRKCSDYIQYKMLVSLNPITSIDGLSCIIDIPTF
jgi:hypothetical protein